MNYGVRIEAELIYIGNCIDYPTVIEGRASNMTTVEIVGGAVEEILVKGKTLPFENDYRNYERWGIEIPPEDNPRRQIGFGDLVRYLHATNSVAIKLQTKSWDSIFRRIFRS